MKANEIIRPGVAEFDELLSLLDRSFGARDSTFRDRLPNIHQPIEEKMRWHYGIRRGGRLVAVVGVYPIQWRVAGRTLDMQGIGAVATDPGFRGQNLMSELMSFVDQDLRERGTQVSILGGSRQRYRRFGWERAGLQIEMGLDRGNLRSDRGYQDLPTLELSPLDAGVSPDELAQLHRWHDDQPMHCLRKPEEFVTLLGHWLARPLVARDRDGLAGYVVLNRSGRGVTELVARDERADLAIVRTLLEQSETGHLSLRRGGLPTALDRWLDRTCQWSSCSESGNWQVFDWPAVIEALLAARCARHPLPDGAVTLGIEGKPRSLRLTIESNAPSVTWTADQPALMLDVAAMMRLLLGPHRPSHSADLPAEAAILDNWCPLPAIISRQDEV